MITRKITCKQCGQRWDNIGEYMKRPPCLNGSCKLTKKEPTLKEVPTVPQIRMRVIRTESEVKSVHSNPVSGCVYVKVPEVISISIYPKGGNKK